MVYINSFNICINIPSKIIIFIREAYCESLGCNVVLGAEETMNINDQSEFKRICMKKIYSGLSCVPEVPENSRELAESVPKTIGYRGWKKFMKDSLFVVTIILENKYEIWMEKDGKNEVVYSSEKPDDTINYLYHNIVLGVLGDPDNGVLM